MAGALAPRAAQQIGRHEMTEATLDRPSFAPLNAAQRLAAQHPKDPLLIIAGVGTGKTNTLAHRVAHLIRQGAQPERILLLTFSRRAALEMTRRTQKIVGETVRDVR